MDADYLARNGRRADAVETGESLSLSIIMTAFNEERTIEQAVGEVLECDLPCDFELIVVDDGSTDRTFDLLAKMADPRVIVYRHEQHRGKGAALLSAAAVAKGTYILPFDAALEYAVDDIARLLDPVVRGRCEVVYGVRLSGYHAVYQSYRYAIGNRALTRVANVLFDACLTDMHTCLKLIPTSLFKSLALRQRRFGIDAEITAMLLRRGVRPYEVPVSYYGRTRAQVREITWLHAVKSVWILLQGRLRRWPADPSGYVGDGVTDGGARDHAVVTTTNFDVDETGEDYVPAAG